MQELEDYYAELVFWEIRGKKFYNKMQALDTIIEKKLDWQELKFHFFDQAFKKYDWKQNLQSSFEELMKQRALQLRNRYDYLRLWYSGGPDSHTMLQPFIENKIHLDEIISYRCSVSNNPMSETNREINDSALPYLETIKSLFPKTKFTVLDIGRDHYFDFFRNHFWSRTTNILRFRPYCRNYFYKWFPELIAPKQKGMSHVNIIGKDKPRITFANDKWYWLMYDGMVASFIGAPFVEYFFITDQLPALHHAQCLLVKSYLETFHDGKSSVDHLFREADLSWLNRLCRTPVHRPVMFEKTGEIVSPKANAAVLEGETYAPEILGLFKAPLIYENGHDTWRFNQDSIFNDLKGTKTDHYEI